MTCRDNGSASRGGQDRPGRRSASSASRRPSFSRSSPAPLTPRTEVLWWHAMSGELGRQLERLAADFNASQSDYRVVPVYKGSYTETVMAAIFAFRSNAQPAIVQVNEIATATMMAAQGRRLSGVRVDAGPGRAVRSGRLSAGRDRLLHRRRRQHAVVSVQRLDADPLLQQDPVQERGSRCRRRAEDLAGGGGGRAQAARRRHGVRLHHPLAVLGQCREFLRPARSADRHQGERLRRARCDAHASTIRSSCATSASSPNGRRRSCSTTAAAR